MLEVMIFERFHNCFLCSNLSIHRCMVTLEFYILCSHLLSHSYLHILVAAACSDMGFAVLEREQGRRHFLGNTLYIWLQPLHLHSNLCEYQMLIPRSHLSLLESAATTEQACVLL